MKMPGPIQLARLRNCCKVQVGHFRACEDHWTLSHGQENSIVGQFWSLWVRVEIIIPKKRLNRFSLNFLFNHIEVREDYWVTSSVLEILISGSFFANMDQSSFI